jgi:RimJ/RimL family protein N-acetyltransferase
VPDDIRVRPTEEADRRRVVLLFAEVAAERVWIGTEPPVDIDARAASWILEGDLVAEVDGEIVGSMHISPNRHGFGEIGMAVRRDWRGRGVGSALMAAAIDWGRNHGLHKLSLGVFVHNDAAIALYRKFDFVEEGRRVKHYRRQNGELWDVIDMGLLL